MPALGVIWPPWQGTVLECFSAVLWSAEITEKRWSFWDTELFICKIQCAKVRRCQHGPVSQSHTAHNLCQKFCPWQTMHSFFHIKQASCQVAFWQQCHQQHPEPPPSETMGWRLEDHVLESVLKPLPSGPDACADLIFCACTKQCTGVSCKCRMSCLPCTATCKCHDKGEICYGEMFLSLTPSVNWLSTKYICLQC